MSCLLARERLALTDEQSALQERYHAAKRERLRTIRICWSTGWPACKPNRNARPTCWSTKYRTFRRCRLPLCGR
ncbi:MAG: hypothetical protein ACLRWP_05100 [Bilophila wadsworthia]